MSKTTGTRIAIVILAGVLGILIWALVGGSSSLGLGMQQPDNGEAAPRTASVERRTIEALVTGPGEIKGSSSSRLELDSKRNFKSFDQPMNTRIAQGETLVSYTYGKPLVAPYDLVVTEKSLPKEGKHVTSEHSLQVTRIDTMNVDISVGQNDVDKIEKGQSVDVAISGDKERVVRGTVESINQVGTYSPSGSKYTVTVSIPNEDGSILVGMAANLSIKTKEAANVLAVPVSAVKVNGQSATVSVVKADGSVVEKSVTPGLSDGKFVEITGEVAEGDQVALNEIGSATETAHSNQPTGTRSAMS
ncbi:efflux RND transporter periplasmic adaptor subunit [Curtanaerobium respiraculi]|uniref:efflux RND transporter periplasmic adaptor subunit n=1 Tax=Curtanaerobium respiraculi TaxID=2949669 RepID=UPI0024B3C00A|nr:HlyD family efflux transporter periplasmic adaptor subunit [Curtanaerobium respiraculi]